MVVVCFLLLLFLNRKSETCLLLGRKQKTRVLLASSQFPLGSRLDSVIANALFPLVLCKGSLTWF